MNNSGVALKEIKDFYNIDINNIYVIHDEIDLDQGRVKLKNGGGKIFQKTAEQQTVWESHNDEVHVVPEGFFITASSPSCEVQGMENEAGDRFGLQFHPEVNDSEFGKEMFENFVEICRIYRDEK